MNKCRKNQQIRKSQIVAINNVHVLIGYIQASGRNARRINKVYYVKVALAQV